MGATHVLDAVAQRRSAGPVRALNVVLAVAVGFATAARVVMSGFAESEVHAGPFGGLISDARSHKSGFPTVDVAVAESGARGL